MAKLMEKRASLTSHDHFTMQQKEMPVLDNNNSRWQHCATESPSLPNPKEQKRNDDVNLSSHETLRDPTWLRPVCGT